MRHKENHSALRSHAFLVIAILLTGLIISAIIANRSFVLGFFASLLVFTCLAFRDQIDAKRIIFACVGFVLLTVFLSIMVKSDSSLGRLLIYKISTLMFLDHWRTGVGLGNFQVKYGLYQASYFAAGDYSQKEFLLADNTYYAFNDYWQWIVETGTIGAIILLAAIIVIIKIVWVALVKKPDSVGAWFMISILVLIATAALFTHVFEKALFRAILLTSVLYLLIIVIKDRLPTLKTIMIIVVACLLMATFPIYRKVLNRSSYNKFEEAKLLISAGNITEGMAIYHKVLPDLKDDVVFLEAYCAELMVSGSPDEALSVLKYTLTKRTSNRLYRDLGNLYVELKQFGKAETSYLTSINMVPNRFLMRRQLLEFYLRTNNIPKARKTADLILRTPVKVGSPVIVEIKRQARNVLFGSSL